MRYRSFLFLNIGRKSKTYCFILFEKTFSPFHPGKVFFEPWLFTSSYVQNVCVKNVSIGKSYSFIAMQCCTITFYSTSVKLFTHQIALDAPSFVYISTCFEVSQTVLQHCVVIFLCLIKHKLFLENLLSNL